MIRDPSDGTVREEINLPANEINGMTVKSSSEGITPIVEDIKAAILAGKVTPERLSPEWVYQRAWNDALDFAITQTSRIEKLYSHPNHEGNDSI